MPEDWQESAEPYKRILTSNASQNFCICLYAAAFTAKLSRTNRLLNMIPTHWCRRGDAVTTDELDDSIERIDAHTQTVAPSPIR